MSCLSKVYIFLLFWSTIKAHYDARMTKFSTNPYFIFQRFKCYTTFIVKELLQNKKPNFFTSISKTFITYITKTITNISNNNTIKQYYDIIKLFKVLVIVKKKQFSKTNILIRTGLSHLLSKLSLISRI